ncbi:hypothetical protein CEXT_182051 [Caerostris extrusa]|uniref:C2H2-type domain-containing protein n=1 Tax=Caerostris extrusa TaxID=172846 RepID=A0AAV4Y259_CAEEX|nr:hypothetical protein CEXT_182051 [Caerostris extrusa]
MEITKCEFCEAYITNLEVHNCVRLGNQYRQTFATLPQCSSDNAAGVNELEEMDYEALWPSLYQSNSSTQQSILPDVYQRTDWEETAAAVMPSQQGVANQNPYNPETSDFLFPHIQEKELVSTHLKQPYEVSKVFINQYPQNYEPSNPKRPDNPPMPVATLCVLPGFQETFGRRNPISNTILPSASSVNCEQNTEEKILDLNTGVCEQKADEPQKTKNTLHKCSRCPMKFKRKDYLESHERVHNVEKPYVCNFCDKVFSNADHFSWRRPFRTQPINLNNSILYEHRGLVKRY